MTAPGSPVEQETTWEYPRSSYQVEARFCREADGGFSAYIPRLPGAISEGESLAEAARNVAEALTGVLEEYLASGAPIPWQEPGETPDGEIELWIMVDVEAPDGHRT